MLRNWFSQCCRAISTRKVTVNTPDHSLIQQRTKFADALHLFVLASFALAQPIYDRLGERPGFLLDQGIGLPAICFLALILSIAVPAVFVISGRLVRRWSEKRYEYCHAVSLFVFVLLFVLPITKRLTFCPAPWSILLAILSSAWIVKVYFRWPVVRTFLAAAAPGILLFPILLLYHSPLTARNAGVSATRGANFQPVPVVVLVCDEFCGSSLMTPDREIDAQRFPNLAALAKQGTWFRNATTINPGTEQAVPAILSGRYPTTLYPPTPSDLPQNLFSVLRMAGGYNLAAFEPVSRLAPSNISRNRENSTGFWTQTGVLSNALSRIYLHHLMPSDVQTYLPGVPISWFGMSERQTIDENATRGVFRYQWGAQRDTQFRHFLKTIDGSEKPSLHFIHVLLPHVPWCFLPSGRKYADDGDDWQLLDSSILPGPDGSLNSDELDIIHKQQRYLLQVMYLDGLIGQLISRMKETGIYDRSLLIVTADHGISFRASVSRRDFEPANHDEILSVPLFVKRPGQTVGATSDRAVESVDILPTIADVVGLTLHSPTDGWSVFDTTIADRKTKTLGDNQQTAQFDPKIILNSKVPHDIRLRFGEHSSPDSLFLIGPIPELLGSKVDGLRKSAASPVALEFRRYSDVMSADPAENVPCYFEGRVNSPLPGEDPLVLAVAVNGTIRGVTRTYLPKAFRDQWTVLVPESAFHMGKNDVQFYSVAGTAPDWQLTPCRTVATATKIEK